MKFPKKTAASVLSVSLLLGNISAFNYDIKPRIVYAENEENQTLSNVEKHEEHKFSNDDRVKIVVKLKEEAVDVDKLKTAEGRKEREESTKTSRENALKEIKNKGIHYEKLFEYNLLLNGFALETKYEDAKKIQDLDFVESVELSVEYESPTVPEASEEVPTSELAGDEYGKVIDSYNLINIQGLWDAGYRGEGKVVAVIDSGFDPNHEVLRLSDASKAKYKTKDEIEKIKKEAGIDYGKWYSDKVPFAFNYNDWDNNLKQETFKSHGMHVAGTAVGNPDHKAPNGQYISGVAPEAQLIFMRVFSESKNSGTESYIYAKALEDAVKLGADTVNMSLGSPSGSVVEIGEGIASAINLAKAAGVNVVVAAGNNAYFSKGYWSFTPKAENPDYGVVGRPSVAEDAISVANISNSVLNRELVYVPQLRGNAEFNNGYLQILTNEMLFDKKEYSYEYVEQGTDSDYADKDMTDKVALIRRGGNSFEDKVKIAKKHGAVGAVIYFNEGEEIFNLTLNGEDKDYPVAAIAYDAGNELKDHADTYKLSFTGEWDIIANANANLMADSTSWGMSVDGYLKPDVTAPGNDVLSSYNNNRYGLNSGTSMASPHVAGAITLVKQVLSDRFPDLNANEIQKLAKHLIMSTANPNYNNTTEAYTSPRRQGAGVIDAYKAAYGDLYVTGENDYGSITLGNINDKFEFKVKLHNLSNQERTLTYRTYVNTDDYYDESAGADWSGRITLNPKNLTYSTWETVVVPANGEAEVVISADATEFSAELEKVFTNGYYLEGFVVFYEGNDEKVSIPYVGFKGEFQNIPVLEKPVYEMTGSEKPIYEYDYDATQKNWTILNNQYSGDEIDATSIITEFKENGQTKGGLAGAYVDPITGESFYGKAIAFSPNGDGMYDRIGARGVFLRAFENMKLSVYAANDSQRANPLYEKGNAQGNKNYFNNTSRKATSLPFTNWDGTDNNGNPLPDGEYQYVLTYAPVVSGAKIQETTFKVVIDRKAPKITGANAGLYDEETRVFTPFPVIEDGSGIFYKKLSNGNNIIQPNEDGTYTIPEGIELKDLTFEVSDLAHNIDKVTLNNVANNGRGSVEVSVLDKNGVGNQSRRLRYKITNEQGEVVGDDFTKNRRTYQALDFGKYKLEVVLSDEDFRILTPKEIDFEITKENPTKEIEFRVEEIEKNMLEVSFDKKAPEGTKVYAIAKDGTRTQIPTSLYGKNAFQKRLENGVYTIEIITPEGYIPVENNFEVEVKDGHNKKQVALEVAEKVSSVETSENSAITGKVEFGDKVLFNNYSLVVKEPNEEAKENIEKMLTEGNIELAKYDVSYYDIHIVDKDGKEVAVEGERNVTLDMERAPERFFHEKDGELVAVGNPNYSEGKLTFTTDSFSNFVALTPKNTPVENPQNEPKEQQKTVNKEELQKLIEADKNIDNNATYTNAKVEAKELYNKAIEEAKKIFANEEATQEEVNNAVAEVNRTLTNLSENQKEKEKIDKTELLQEIQKAEGITQLAKFKNTTQDKQANYISAIEEAVNLIEKEDLTTTEIKTAIEKLHEAEKNLDGVENNNLGNNSKKETPAPIPNNGETPTTTPNNGETPSTTPNNGETPTTTPNNGETSTTTQNNGEIPANVVNKQQLFAQLNNLSKVLDKKSYKEANKQEQENYTKAVKNAQEILADKNATQEQVDQALKELKEAEKAVNKDSFLEKTKDLLGGFVGNGNSENKPFNTDQPTAKDLGGKVTNSKVLLAKTGLNNTSTIAVGVALLALAGLLISRKMKK